MRLESRVVGARQGFEQMVLVGGMTRARDGIGVLKARRRRIAKVAVQFVGCHWGEYSPAAPANVRLRTDGPRARAETEHVRCLSSASQPQRLSVNRTNWSTLRGPRAGAVAAKFRSQPKNAPPSNLQINEWEGEGGLTTPSEVVDTPIANRSS